MNYTGTFSVVLFGVEDATYKFLYLNFGCQVHPSDGAYLGALIFER